MKKYLFLLLICLSFNTSYSLELKGNIETKYKVDFLDKNEGKYIDEDKRQNGYLNINGNLDLDFENNFHLINTFEFRPVQKRVYDGGYGHNSIILNNSPLIDDFYGKENHLKRKYHFSHYGLIAEELYIKYKEEAFLVGLGKFNPSFGYAHDKNRLGGVYNARLSDEYALREKLGAFVAFDSEFFVLRGDFFFDDQTFLSEDLFQRRGIDKSEYGAGATKKLNNFSVTSELIFDTKKLYASIRRLAVTNSEERAEKGYLVGFQNYLEENEYEFGLNPLVELAYFENFNGNKDRDVIFTTASLPLFYKGWNFVGSYTLKHDKEKFYKNYASYIAQISVGYEFKNGVAVNVAKKREKSAKKTTNSGNTKEVKYYDSWGFDIAYNFKF